MAISAFAKLNLFLHITGRRPDGYHLLQSVFVRIDWRDQLQLHCRDDGQLIRHDTTQPLPADDLCLRAARSLQQASGTLLGADIHIDKQIPSGAGMGGGSADAAAVLCGLNALWGLNWPLVRLAEMAVPLGADVPFFVHGRHAWVEGIGEQVQPLVLPDQLLGTPLAVLKPPVVLPTKDIFTHPALPRQTAPVTQADFLVNALHFGQNDMQCVACQVAPEVSQALGILQSLFGQARMTGSGSAVFAWLPEGMDVHLAQQNLQRALPSSHWAARICHLLAQ
jgi:4-diphosphocytidyl-2-C-methyl-D-erythritol kinase